MANKYTEVARFNLFKEKDKEVGSKRPDYGNGKVVLDVDLPAGRYSVGGWQYADSGNIGLKIERDEIVDDGGFD